MIFYNRETELALLSQWEKGISRRAQMTVLTGRRRSGKTTLLFEAYKNSKWTYLFVSRKTEALLCEEFVRAIEASLQIKILGEFKSFARLFEYLLEYSIQVPFTLVIDEFQEFYQINAAVYSEIQDLWDRYKRRAKINLIFSGSIYSLMKKIFENNKEPLFGRANHKIHLKPFGIEVIKEICTAHFSKMSKQDFLAFYAFTGGVAKYVEHFVDAQARNFEGMLNTLLNENSIFLNEGRNILIEEFGKTYTTYFSILSLIASGKTSRTEIESILQKDIGGYLEILEKDFNLIQRVQPVFAKPGGRLQKYVIEDNFLNFWFRFIYRNQSAVEIGNFDYIKDIIRRDFSAYSGKTLEKFFIEKLKSQKIFSKIGSYWERGHQNEIDIVAVNEMQKKILFVDVKLNPIRSNLPQLQQKSFKIMQELQGYQAEYQTWSLENILE